MSNTLVELAITQLVVGGAVLSQIPLGATNDNGETEIYFVLQGAGKICVGAEVHELAPGVCIVTPPDTLHCTAPHGNLVVAVVNNTAPFNADNYVAPKISMVKSWQMNQAKC